MVPVRPYSSLQEMEEVGMTNKNIHFHSFKNGIELRDKLCNAITVQLQNAIRKKGKASLLVSGGNTPKPLFAMLSKSDILWEKVSVGLCDERWVSPLHADSNEKLVRDTLLQGNAKMAKFIGMYNEKAISESTCSEKTKAELYPFDVVVLGMGSDGHTASLFPFNERLEEAFDLTRDTLCIAIKPKMAPHNRMSLTLKAILSAKNLFLHIEGSEKLDVYEKALKGKNSFEMPIRAVLHQNTKDLEVYYA